MANVIQSASRSVSDAQPVMLKARVDKSPVWNNFMEAHWLPWYLTATQHINSLLSDSRE